MDKLLMILEDVRPDIDFNNEKNLVTDGILDSFDVITIVDEISEEFEIDNTPKYLTADNFSSAETIWELIKMLKG